MEKNNEEMMITLFKFWYGYLDKLNLKCWLNLFSKKVLKKFEKT